MSYINLNSLKYDKNLTISVCVPCIPRHIKYLNELMNSINIQSVLPNEVIIFISECTEPQYLTTYNFLKLTFPRLNIIMGHCEARQYAGPNRNAAAKIATGDIISFMDADDIMHPLRTEYILKMFSTFAIDGLLHHYIQNAEFERVHILNPSVFVKVEFDYKFSDYIQHGHPSFKRAIFNEISYGNAARGQDFDFIIEFLKTKKLAILCVPLTLYRAQYSTAL